MKESAYVDSNIFLYPVLYSKEADPRVNKASEILKNIAKGELLAFTSVLTWDEVVWVVRKTMGITEAQSQGQKLLGFLNLQFIEVDENILSQAQGLISKYSLKPRDAIHIASAINQKLELMISDDQDFDRIKEINRIPLT
ncbi:type II toxin-antitoxin system VapC family toxin [Candidatus Bathycorpusculum sp.]|uniref:type II toxin-antitoxin system VapC family toxin n=1 Tax=Candidatus Bathycorpusculum sp. TaxID=2994959 RepID=UPI0028275B00|nr:type II toxin-antitoxin system VapC family toxin [Candidatus Termitimicrobium sp.]MCL2432631.1 type II toxin-antitoxin system VapC family toxin [Candidatus Termitimicrobium sp.]